MTDRFRIIPVDLDYYGIEIFIPAVIYREAWKETILVEEATWFKAAIYREVSHPAYEEPSCWKRVGSHPESDTLVNEREISSKSYVVNSKIHEWNLLIKYVFEDKDECKKVIDRHLKYFADIEKRRLLREHRMNTELPEEYP